VSFGGSLVGFDGSQSLLTHLMFDVVASIQCFHVLILLSMRCEMCWMIVEIILMLLMMFDLTSSNSIFLSLQILLIDCDLEATLRRLSTL